MQTIVSLAVSLVLHVHFLYRTEYRPALPRTLVGPVAALGVAWGATVLLATLVVPSWRLGWLGMSPQVGWQLPSRHSLFAMHSKRSS